MLLSGPREDTMTRDDPAASLSKTIMQIAPIDLTALVATILGISIVLVPVIGLTARFALAPTVEALSRFFDHKGLGKTVQIMERRIVLQEQQIELLESSIKRLTDVSNFHQQLESGDGSSAGEETPS
jgi:hypothetical protein